MKKKHNRDIKKIILHCSDSKIGNVETIRRWHLERGWSDIGYHYVVKRDGNVEKGRDVDTIGAHCLHHNADSLGICYIGGTEKNDINEKQFNSLILFLVFMLQVHGLEVKDLYGHYEFNSGKACPNLDMDAVREQVDALRYQIVKQDDKEKAEEKKPS